MAKSNNKNVLKYQARLLEQGSCLMCRQPVEIHGKRRCDVCNKKKAEQAKKYRAKKRASGVCTECKSGVPVNGNTRCTTCVLKRASVKLWRDSSRWEDLANLFNKQNGLCPYSGVSLVVGKDAEVDHIIPKSKGGSSEINNLQWVLKGINRMKHGMAHKEFSELLSLIVKNISQ